MPNLADLFASAITPSRNVEHRPVNWPAFMAEQFRNVPPIDPGNRVPPPLGGQLSQLSKSVDDYGNRVLPTNPGPQHPFARYVLPNPDQAPYDPLYEWNRQHR